MPIQMYRLAAQGLPELDQGLNNRGHRNQMLPLDMFVAVVDSLWYPPH